MHLGFVRHCEFPWTGTNCTEIMSDKVTPTLDYVIVVGVVMCTSLIFPTLWTVYRARTELRSSRNRSRLSGCGIRYMCALSLLIGQFGSMAWLLTGLNMVHPASGVLGVLSFVANGTTILSFYVSAGCIFLLARMIFIFDIENVPMSKSIVALKQVGEGTLMLVFIGPAAAAYLLALFLAVGGVVVDNIMLVRIAMGGCSISCAVLYVLDYTLAWPAIRTLRAISTGGKCTAGDISWKASGNAQYVAKVSRMTTKLSAQLKSQDGQALVLGFMFAFLCMSNVLHMPEFFMALLLYDLTFLLPLHTIMTLVLIHKKAIQKREVAPMNLFDDVAEAT